MRRKPRQAAHDADHDAARTAVILTIDAEVAPHTSDWRRDRGRFALDRDVYGITDQGERGLRYQLEVLERHRLKSVVFIEALSAGSWEIASANTCGIFPKMNSTG